MLHLTAIIIAIDNLFAGQRSLLKCDLREVSAEFVILVLGPFLERMVVALVAIESHSEECLAHILGDFARLTQHAEIIDGRIFIFSSLASTCLSMKLLCGASAHLKPVRSPMTVTRLAAYKPSKRTRMAASPRRTALTSPSFTSATSPLLLVKTASRVTSR